MIKIEKEDIEALDSQNMHENCCFCNKPTPYWAVKKDVACCPDCAEKYEEVELPSKYIWFAQQERKGGF